MSSLVPRFVPDHDPLASLASTRSLRSRSTKLNARWRSLLAPRWTLVTPIKYSTWTVSLYYGMWWYHVWSTSLSLL